MAAEDSSRGSAVLAGHTTVRQTDEFLINNDRSKYCAASRFQQRDRKCYLILRETAQNVVCTDSSTLTISHFQ